MKLSEQAEAAFRHGNHSAALSLYQKVFELEEPDLISLLLAAKSCVSLKMEELAIQYYNQAIALAPSHATAFSRKTCLLMSKKFGVIQPAPASRERKQISMRSLGNKGRFGNQIFQYGFLKCYAEKFSLDIGTMEWPGTYLFDINDPRPNTPNQAVRESAYDMISALHNTESTLSGKEVTGYFQFDTHLWATHKQIFQQTFRPSKLIAKALKSALSIIRPSEENLVAMHLRRGDFLDSGISTAPAQWYLNWLEEHWNSIDSPRLYIATDAPELLRDFSKFSPLSYRNLKLDCSGFEFAIDWFILQKSKIVCTSNSTFSMSATLTNETSPKCFRPSFEKQKLVSFNPWNTSILSEK